MPEAFAHYDEHEAEPGPDDPWQTMAHVVPAPRPWCPVHQRPGCPRCAQPERIDRQAPTDHQPASTGTSEQPYVWRDFDPHSRPPQ